jgi:hypothetical protein
MKDSSEVALADGRVAMGDTGIDLAPDTPPYNPIKRQPPPHGWRDLGWGILVRTGDWFLRRYYRVKEFTSDPDCLIRVRHTEATQLIELPDARVLPGDPVLDLHMWNEQLPRFLGPGADFCWAILIRRNLHLSITALARYVASSPECRQVRAIRAGVTFANRGGRTQIRRAAARFGFEMVERCDPDGWHELGEDMLIWAFARAFNPAALRCHRLRRDRTELWISRERLLQLFE